MCVMCGVADETEHHMFFECEFSRVMWYYCSLQLDIVNLEGRDFREYWKRLCARFLDNDRQVKLLQECVHIMWRIWKSQNKMVFKGVLVNPMEMVNIVRRQLLQFPACHGVNMVTAAGCVAGGDILCGATS